jgi:hypothetical protein
MSDDNPLLAAALAYAARGWPVFPVGPDKRPCTKHGHLDATTDTLQIERWWRWSTDGRIAIATGEQSGVIALDIDVHSDLKNGFDSLDNLGVSIHPETPTTHSPSGGCHMLFRWPGHFVKTSVGELGPGLDIKADRSSLTLPPAPGRFWDPHLGPDTSLADMPAWMVIPEPEPVPLPVTARPARPQPLSRYGEAALDGAVKAIAAAPDGEQRGTLNREVYAIAGLVAGNVIPSALALEALNWAAAQMRSYDPRRPWRPSELDRAVRDAFMAGLAHPRHPARRRAA